LSPRREFSPSRDDERGVHEHEHEHEHAQAAHARCRADDLPEAERAAQ
jgi:hypothetical protein